MMIPVETGIVDFIENFIKQNNASISEINPEKRQAIYLAFE